MKKEVLADELRKRQIELGLNPPELVNAISDDQIIDSYITCADCGQKEIPSSMVGWLIGKAENADQFFNLVDQISSHFTNDDDETGTSQMYNDSNKMSHVEIQGEIWKRTPCDEKECKCGDCGAEAGQYHYFNCDMERCPRCGCQLISCDCGVAYLINDDVSNDIDIFEEFMPEGNDQITQGEKQ